MGEHGLSDLGLLLFLWLRGTIIFEHLLWGLAGSGMLIELDLLAQRVRGMCRDDGPGPPGPL